MPLHLPFNFPYLFGPRYKNYNTMSNLIHTANNSNITNTQFENKKEDSNENNETSSIESSDYFFEIFGLKLYYDDIIIISLLFFLYTEGVKDQELFICLILLLLT